MRIRLFSAIFVLLSAASNCLALDLNHLIGEWSRPKECVSTRYVFTQDGKYMWLKRTNNREWKTGYEGIFIALTKEQLIQSKIHNNDAVVIAEGKDQGGHLVQIELVTKDRLKGYWDAERSDGLSFENPKDTRVDYVRCKSR